MKSLMVMTLLVGCVLSSALLSGKADSATEVNATAQTPPTEASEAPEPAATPETASIPTPQAAAQSQDTPAPQTIPGMTVYKDPETGRLLPLPADELQKLLSQDLRNAISTSHEGLIEKETPGGGVMIDLRGRFRNMTWATKGPDGKVVTHCDSGESASSTQPPQAPKE